MKKLGIYDTILDNGKIALTSLQEKLQNYQQQATLCEDEARKKGLQGEELADEFFNSLDERRLLCFENNTQHIELLLGRYHEVEEEAGESTFGACYVIEERDIEEFGLMHAEEFMLGEEEAVLSTLKKLGYHE